MEMYFPKLILNGIQCFKGDKATQGELGTPGCLGGAKPQGVNVAHGKLGPLGRLGDTLKLLNNQNHGSSKEL